MTTETRPRCGIRHQIPEIVCIRPAGHAGPCYSKWEPTGGGAIRRAAWWSLNGQFWQHGHYHGWYPENATRPTPGGAS